MSLYKMFSRRSDWELAIGRLMLASAKIEMHVLQIIANYGSEDVAKEASKLPHTARLNIMQRLADRTDDETQEGAAKIVDKLRSINKNRNHVAHNPLTYALGREALPGNQFGAIVAYRNKGVTTGLRDVKDMAEEAHDISSCLSFIWMTVMGPPP